MTHYRVVVATTDEEEAKSLRKELGRAGRFQLVDVIPDGIDCVRTIVSDHRIDLVILNLQLHQIDGIEVMKRLESLMATRPKFLVLSSAPQMMPAALAAGAGYSMYVPCQYETVVQRALQLLEPAGQVFSDEEIDWQVCCMFQELNAPIHMEGFRHIRAAALMLQRQPRLARRRITTELYPAIAELCNSSKTRVERNLRSFIAAVYTHGNMDALARYRLNTLSMSHSGSPSNSVFLNAVANQVTYALRQKKAKSESGETVPT